METGVEQWLSAIRRVLQKEEAGFALIWQLYAHGRELNCLCFSAELVSELVNVLRERNQ